MKTLSNMWYYIKEYITDILPLVIAIICILAMQCIVVYWCSLLHWSIAVFVGLGILVFDIKALIDK